VLRPHAAIEQLAEHEPPDAFAVGAFDDGQLVAVGLIGAEGDRGDWRVRGMAALPAVRGRGAGTAVLDALLRHAGENGATRAWARVRTPARSLYERAGFAVVSEEYELPEIGPHLTMSRELAGAAR
jgi:GNAT superfamily N-acetyltransferase